MISPYIIVEYGVSLSGRSDFRPLRLPSCASATFFYDVMINSFYVMGLGLSESLQFLLRSVCLYIPLLSFKIMKTRSVACAALYMIISINPMYRHKSGKHVLVDM
jgi:hypothetical protein